jgi:UDP-glucose 4-epimerase
MDEFLALAHHSESGLDVVVARLFNTVGPRQSGAYGMVVPRFVGAALADEPLEVHGDGNQTRCFCHVADTSRALVDLLGHGGLWGEIYNVGSTESLTINDLAERVLAATGSSSTLTYIPYDEVYGHGIEEMFHRIPDLAKIRAAIGWEPTIALGEIIADVIAAQRSHHVAEPAT